MKYKKGYKYQLVEKYTTNVQVFPTLNINTPFIALTMEGLLTIQKYYAWDGASGPTLDTKDTMIPSLVHDALYQLLREGYLAPYSFYHLKNVDEQLDRMLRKRGMSGIRRWIWRRGLALAGGSAALPENVKEIFEVS